MGLGDEISAAGDGPAGAAVEEVGDATDHRDLQAKGRAQHAAGHAD